MAIKKKLGFDGLVLLLDEVKSGVAEKDFLLNTQVKSAVKDIVNEAGSAADIIEISENPSSQESQDNEEIVQSAFEVLRTIFAIDKSIFNTLCEHAGFHAKQIKVLTSNIQALSSNNTKAAKLLLESHAEGKLLIQNPHIQKLLAFNQYLDHINHLDAFIRYIAETGTKSVQLEKIARLTIYQKQKLSEDLKNNPELQKLFKKFTSRKTKEEPLTEEELGRCKDLIVSACVEHMNQTPIAWSFKESSDGTNVPCAIHSDKREITINSFEQKSPGGWPDAWGVFNEHLDVFSVTTIEDFSTQASQAFEQAYSILNGIKTGYLEDIKTFLVWGWCGSILNGGDHKKFNEVIDGLVKNEEITESEYNVFKTSPIHVEALKLLRLNCVEKYSELASNVCLGIHADDKNAYLSLKPADLQFEMSFSNITRSIKVLEKVLEKNPSLDQMGVAFERATLCLACPQFERHLDKVF